MEIGIGLPNMIPGVEGTTLVAWARTAEEAGFASLGTVGRLLYDGFDDLITLAAAAAVTERVRLTTGILVGPVFANNALLAKQTASIDRLSGGRLVLGIGLGGRDDDYVVSGLPTEKRGRTLNRQLEDLKRFWGQEDRGVDDAIGPVPARPGGPEVIIGGYTPAAFRRTARYGDGWMMGAGGSPEAFAEVAPQVDAAWTAEGRAGTPRKIKPHYFALGPTAQEDADRELGRYYARNGPEIAKRLLDSALIGEEAVRAAVEGFRGVGVDELVLMPCAADLDQIARLRDVLG